MDILGAKNLVLISVGLAFLADVLFYAMDIRIFIGVSSAISGVITFIATKLLGDKLSIQARNILFLVVALALLYLTGSTMASS